MNNSVVIVDKLVASLTSIGAVSSLFLSFRIISLPTSLFALSFARPCAKEITKINDVNSSLGKAKIVGLIHNSSSWLLYITFLIVLLFVFQAESIIYTMFKRGEFSTNSVSLVGKAFFWYTFAIIPISIITLYSRIYRSLGKLSITLYASIVNAILNIVLDVVLYNTSLGFGGIALATGIASFFQMIILGFGLRQYLRLKQSLLVIRNLFIAGIFASIPLIVVNRYNIVETENWVVIFGITLIVSIISTLIYSILILILEMKKNKFDKLHILLSGGGTGGHVYPALSILRIIEKGKVDVIEKTYVGIKGRAEEIIVSRHDDIQMKYVKSAPISGLGLIGKIKGMLVVFTGVIQSIPILLKKKPHIVIGTGGYASAPLIFAAILLRPFLKLRIIIHEQNIAPGLLNKLSSFFADVTLISFKESTHYLWNDRNYFIGYPLRQQDYERLNQHTARSQLEITDDRFLTLIVGGSLGSRSINTAICDIFEKLISIDKIQLIHVAGMYDTNEYQAYYDTLKRIKDKIKNTQLKLSEISNAFEVRKDGNLVYQCFQYIHNFYKYQKAADLIISRAGAGGVSEIIALGKASILIPKRGLPGDHQELNAISIAEKKACKIVFESKRNDGVDVIDSVEIFDQIHQFVNVVGLKESIATEIKKLQYFNPSLPFFNLAYRS